MAVHVIGDTEFVCPHCGGHKLLIPIVATGQGAIPVSFIVGDAVVDHSGQGASVPQGQPCFLCGDCIKPVTLTQLVEIAQKANALPEEEEKKDEEKQEEEQKEEGE